MVNNDKIWAVIPAAGIGSRMRADRPKQYLDLEGKTILELTLERLALHPNIDSIILAIAKHDPWWPDVNLGIDCPIYVITGGQRRSDSVLNALSALDKNITANDPWILVHDAARPCVRHQDIDNMLAKLCQYQVGVVLGIPVRDTIKLVNMNDEIKKTVCRYNLWRASTPQIFRLRALMRSLQSAKQRKIIVTDDASAMELNGIYPKMIEGAQDNIKITVLKDLELANLYLQQQRKGI
ncbi:MAG: 2-C-methyl-D-erythritol 4-phosphate cytidylyltransferase [Piscirickettsiaceae bacterium]|nr:2-C-methyl-D-erythritol 4-phosphate cytidylyltransferase [Piscirickettsiaceae bacterium]